jgi:hypothetical protein
MAAPDILTRIYSSLKKLPLGPSSPQAIVEFVESFSQAILTVALYGTETNDDADPGWKGEVIDSGHVSGISIPSATQVNIASIDLTPGDWQVYGYAGLSCAAGTSVTAISGGSSPVSADLSLGAAFVHFGAAVAPGAGAAWQYAIPTRRYKVPDSVPFATIWLVGFALYTSTAPTALGGITARRMR